MQIKLFTIPVSDNGAGLNELNLFLRANKVLELENHLVNNQHGALWCFCVRYIEKAFGQKSEKKEKIDYKKVLDEATFQKFSELRKIRKQIAVEEGISAFIIFTDEELAELAKLEKITPKTMLKIKGVGEKKVERFAGYFISNSVTDEESRKSD